MQTPRSLSVLLLVGSLVACTSPAPAVDGGGVDGGAADAIATDDAPSVDAERDAGVDDGAISDAATLDALASDAWTAPGHEALVIVARRGSTELAASSFAAGAWTPMATIGTDDLNLGVGAAVIRDGSAIGIATSTTGARTVESTSWTGGTWASQTATPLTANDVSIPLPTADGRALLAMSPTTIAPIAIATYDPATAGWLAATEATSIVDERSHALVGPPALALGAAGTALLAFARIDTGMNATFRFSVRSGGAWGTETPLPGATSTNVLALPRIVLTSRADGSEIVAVWNEGAAGSELRASSYANGVWSSPTSLATDAVSGGFRPFVAAHLPDDRIALAYLTQTSGIGAIAIGFFDGTAWSAFRRVPGATVAFASYPIAIGRGVEGAALEVAYIEATTNHLQHVRLTDEAPWSWTSPTTVDATSYDCVALASGP